ncbi:hypothetical protein Plec18167_005123 [Paecilomyces lecythidis]|uniref:Ankyrin repeat protein n=1 Tax=Paecilomyces lecythidis TaxID=3004212 RepID=A0ABR3XL50_9EURO
MARSRSRSTVASDNNARLEPKLLRATEQDDTDALRHIIQEARSNGQFSDDFLRIGLMRSATRGCVAATQFLLSQGAKTDVEGNQPTPLLRAVEKNHIRVVQLLLEYGASPETQDKKGRTPLMTAAWHNHWHILHLLICRGADVNRTDHRRRNVLHNLGADKQCDWGEDIIHLLLDTDCKVDAQDELGRTPLHWACATGKVRLAQMLLSRTNGPRADINATEMRTKTALHIAAAHDRDDMIELLLKYNADIHARSDGGWTPLHNACDKGSEKIVRLLLRAGSDVNSQLLNGATSLHLAAQGGHLEVVQCLLEIPETKRRIRDTFGSTPFLRAAQFRRKDIVRLLAPFNHVEALSEDARGACEGFDATVVDFGNYRNENRVRKISVFELLYGRDPENPRKQAFMTLPDEDKATDFRWIHLPANNMAWVEALLTKSFIEEGASDVEGFKGLEKSFNYQHRGQRVHSVFMRPLCQSTPRAPRNRDEVELEKRQEPIIPSILIGGQSKGVTAKSITLQDAPPKKQKPSTTKGERQDSSSHDDTGDSLGKKGKGSGKRGRAGQDNTKVEQKKLNTGSDHRRALPSPAWKDPTAVTKTNICVFMPYLHFETTEGRRKMQEAIQRAEMRTFHPGLYKPRTCDEMLIRAHLTSSTTSLHVRRTLDQFFYPNIDTRSRDQDQVVYRYQIKDQGSTRCSDEPKIFMVDQLWMWILGKNLLVTSFPQRWEQPKNDPLNVLDGIIEDINSKTRDPVQSVYDLAMTITNRCSGVFDRHRMGDEEYQFLDMFESSIGTATDRETVLFKEFNEASAQASEWLKHHRKANRFAQNLESASKQHDRKDDGGDGLDDEDEDQEPLFVDKLLDIGQETDLLAEAKDIRDELRMIRTVLEHQEQVLLALQESICDIYHGEHRSQHEVKKRFKDQQRTIEMHVKDVDRMDKQAERIYASITDLLDLKQKHANAFEARFARDQAAGTARQGKTIMVFTIVTIIFLPLSFITSFFAINISDLPHDNNGQQGLPLSYVAKYTFGIGFAISIPLIFLALSIDDIRDAFQHVSRKIKQWQLIRKKPQHQGHGQNESARTLQVEKILSVARSQRSSDSVFTTSVLPVSTRDAPRSVYRYANGAAKTSFLVRSSREVSRGEA